MRSTTTFEIERTGVLERVDWKAVARFLGIAFQLGLLVLVIREFRIESRSFFYLVALAFAGFLIHANLPRRYRMPFFLALSITGIGVVLGVTSAAWLIALGLVLIGICHLPISFAKRVGLLVVVGAALVVLRIDMLPSPWSRAIWPILGSMFMFRMIIYLYDLKHDKTPATFTSTLSYFFLLPNVAFPLFPVVDYRTFRRTYYDDEEYRIYQKGIEWMFRGILHLILYRFVYYYLTIRPEEVQTAGDLATFLVTNYLLYLRISGHFHLIVGMLHLFGFNLPETHHLYYLASSFTDYWRRINIYWKDFMMKIFYYPSFFGLRRLGNRTALVLSTFVVFAATFLLHSYQWFWIRGSFPLALQDALFWSALAVLVAVNALRETKKGRKRSLSGPRWSLGELPGVALRTAGTFVVICVLWSLWTSGSVAEWLDLWTVLRPGQLAFEAGELGPVLFVTFVVFGTSMIGGRKHKAGPDDTELDRPLRLRLWRRGSVVTGLSIVALYLVSLPSVHARIAPGLSNMIQSLQEKRLSTADRALLERGYYEELLGVDRFNSELWSLYTKQPGDWVNLWQTEAVRWTDDILRLELRPSVQISYKGESLTTNRWGMRDRDYSMEKPAGVTRIAVLGSSPVMGSGVGDGETFEALLESRLNGGGSMASSEGRTYEVLNFAVDGYTLLQQLFLMERKVPRFEPDVAFYIAHETDLEKTVGQLATLLESSTEISYPELLEIADRAGVTAEMDRETAARRLLPFGEEILRWGYRRFAATAAEQGIVPIWIFVPMPAVGRGAPCEGGSVSMCFGNTRQPGAAADRTDPRVAEILELAEEAGLTTLDLSGVYEGVELQELWTAEWDRHPNARAQRLIAERLHRVLLEERDRLPPGLFSYSTSLSARSQGGQHG